MELSLPTPVLSSPDVEPLPVARWEQPRSLFNPDPEIWNRVPGPLPDAPPATQDRDRPWPSDPRHCTRDESRPPRSNDLALDPVPHDYAFTFRVPSDVDIPPHWTDEAVSPRILPPAKKQCIETEATNPRRRAYRPMTRVPRIPRDERFYVFSDEDEYAQDPAFMKQFQEVELAYANVEAEQRRLEESFGKLKARMGKQRQAVEN
jgi:hypothetical protein